MDSMKDAHAKVFGVLLRFTNRKMTHQSIEWQLKANRLIQYTVLFLFSCKFYHFLILFSSLSIYNFCTLIRLVFWNSIHYKIWDFPSRVSLLLVLGYHAISLELNLYSWVPSYYRGLKNLSQACVTFHLMNSLRQRWKLVHECEKELSLPPFLVFLYQQEWQLPPWVHHSVPPSTEW